MLERPHGQPAPRAIQYYHAIRDYLAANDLDSYRAEKRAMQRIMLPDEDAEIGPVPGAGGGYRGGPELDRLSNLLRTFNEHFGDIKWEDADRVWQLIIETIPERVRGHRLPQRPAQLRPAETPASSTTRRCCA